MANDILSYIPINVKFADASIEQESYVSDYEDIIEYVDISECFPYKVNKTTMDPEFLVITNECNDDMKRISLGQENNKARVKDQKDQSRDHNQHACLNLPLHRKIMIKKPVRLKLLSCL
ncbi:hypothetical protein L1987_65410 [Smallanthus sonchifolius]|uniref:Uncharacterized protein n=1 Tax=Smallanthus sonchifolius TaxID=185202 RepID=A0ACB9BUL0_9ASTR|nr:hypothetical protein L1987_65410 [Smallanthus sonchifolius]